MPHAFRSPSSAKMWLDCAQYVLFKRAHPELVDTGGEAADRGTMLHSVVEGMVEAYKTVGGESYDDVLDAADLNAHDRDSARSAFEMARSLILDTARASSHIGLEVGVTLPYEEESQGTVDLMIIDGGHLIVADYKFGQVEVHPRTYQLMIYAASAWRSLHRKGHEIERITIAVIQPATGDEPTVIEVDPGDLGAFMAYVEETVRRQDAGEDRRGASNPDTCQYCPFKMQCPTNQRMLDEAMDAGQDILEGLANRDTIERFYQAKPMIEDALKLAKEAIVKDEKTFPNWERIERASARTWDPLVEEEEIAHQLRLRYGIENPYRLRTVGDLKKEIGRDAELDDFLASKRTHILLRAKD